MHSTVLFANVNNNAFIQLLHSIPMICMTNHTVSNLSKCCIPLSTQGFATSCKRSGTFCNKGWLNWRLIWQPVQLQKRKGIFQVFAIPNSIIKLPSVLLLPPYLDLHKNIFDHQFIPTLGSSHILRPFHHFRLTMYFYCTIPFRMSVYLPLCLFIMLFDFVFAYYSLPYLFAALNAISQLYSSNSSMQLLENPALTL